MDQSLLNYIKNSHNQGFSRPNIEQALLQAGWKKEDIDSAFNQIAPNQQSFSSTSSSIDNHSQQSSPQLTIPSRKNFLMYGLVILALLTLIGGIGVFLFTQTKIKTDTSPLEETQLDRTITLPSPSPTQSTQRVVTDEPEETCKPEDKLEIMPYKKSIFKICYPKNWSIDESGLAGTTVIFKNPEPDQEAKLPLNSTLNVLTSPSRGFDLDAFINDSKANLPKVFPNYTLVEDKRITVNGKTAHILGATYTLDILKIMNRQMIIVEGARVYIVTATALNSAWKKYQDLFEVSMQTFEII